MATRQKRRLISDPETEQDLRIRKRSCFSSPARVQTSSKVPQASPCAYLTTVDAGGKHHAIELYLDRPTTIGRQPTSNYVMNSTSVSRRHCRIHPVRAGGGSAIIISCAVTGGNGIRWNKHPVRSGSSIILLDGDVIHILSGHNTFQAFTCVHSAPPATQSDTLFPMNNVPHGLQPPPIVQGTFEIRNHVLGSGSYATVRLAFDKATARQVACKTIDLKQQHVRTEAVKNEIKLLRKLKHPNINGILSYIQHGRFVHLFLELSTGGDLHTYLNAQGILKQNDARYVGYQLMLGLEYLHQHRISHRDLKPENVLLLAPGPWPRVMIADFGLSRPRGVHETYTVCGTPSYYPPEAAEALYLFNQADQTKRKTVIGTVADCWSLGIVLYYILSGNHPFEEDEYDEPLHSSSVFLQLENLPSGAAATPTLAQTSKHSRARYSNVAEAYSQNQHHNQPSALPEVMIDDGERRVWGREDDQLMSRIMFGEVKWKEHVWELMPEARAVISSLLIKNPSKRANVRDVMASEWIQSKLDQMQEWYETQVQDTYIIKASRKDSE